MTKRYYYTDPLAAAWMAKHFGMRLECRDEDGDYSDFLEHLPGGDTWDQVIADDFHKTNMIYIHQGSENLLNPINSDSKYWLKNDRSDIRVRERNGIPFMWPEVEEVEV
jgi:hypothetical protein